MPTYKVLLKTIALTAEKEPAESLFIGDGYAWPV